MRAANFFCPAGLLSSELACDAVPSRVALSSELLTTAIMGGAQRRHNLIVHDALGDITNSKI